MNLVNVRSSVYGSTPVIKEMLKSLGLSDFKNPLSASNLDTNEEFLQHISEHYSKKNGFVIVDEEGLSFGTLPVEQVDPNVALDFLDQSLGFEYTTIFEFISDESSIFYGVFPNKGVYLLGITHEVSNQKFFEQMLEAFFNLSSSSFNNFVLQ
jgi:hypothetical protein